MIVFDLRCPRGDVFEAWFASSTAFEEQRQRGLLRCPICGDADIGKAVMAPQVASKSNRASITPDTAKAALKALAQAQAAALKESRWVGSRFADQARAMHLGDRPKETIHGCATIGEAQALAEDGVGVTPLPFPVLPPEAAN